MTDHKLFRVKFNLLRAACKRGKGYFKINTLLLEEKGIENFVEPRIQKLIENQDHLSLRWEEFKIEVREFFQKLGKFKAKERNMKRKHIESSIFKTENLILASDDIFVQDHLKSYLKRCKQELEELNNFYLANCRHNTYYKDYVDDKISFTSAKALQRKDWEQRHLYTIQKEDGSVTAVSHEIVEVIKNQYANLFKPEGISVPTLTYFLNQTNFPKLQDIQKVSLDDPLLPREVKDAIHAMQGKKTPGFDSIPIEFYWKYSDFFSEILCTIFNSFLVSGKMYSSAYMGIISLLYKGAGERSLRENWRPLTLLNVDYKIFAKVLSRRLEKVHSHET
jgi:hypothetical protein